MGFYFWSAVMIVSLSITGLTIRALALEGIALSETLILRGIVCLFIVSAWARKEKLGLIPKSIKAQTIRALIAGLALTFFSLSYNWLSASTVAVISNIDVPLLVVLGSLVGQASSKRAKILSVVSIFILIVYCLKIQSQPNWVLGISTLLTGLFLLCFGYAFIKKSMTEENQAITVLTPSLALIAYGLAQKFIETSAAVDWTTYSFLVGIVSGLGMFGAYYATMKLYEQTDIATAEFPTLLAPLVIQPFEWLFFQESVSVLHLVLTVAFIVCTYFVVNIDKSSASAVNYGS